MHPSAPEHQSTRWETHLLADWLTLRRPLTVTAQKPPTEEFSQLVLSTQTPCRSTVLAAAAAQPQATTATGNIAQMFKAAKRAMSPFTSIELTWPLDCDAENAFSVQHAFCFATAVHDSPSYGHNHAFCDIAAFWHVLESCLTGSRTGDLRS